VHDDLSLEHVEHLIRVGMDVKGRHLPLLHVVLEEQERAVRVFGRGLPGMQPATVEPTLLTLAASPYDHSGSVHGFPSLPERYGTYGPTMDSWVSL
jgi:hypothetical protein